MLGRIGKDAGSLLGIEILPASVRLLQLARGRPRAWAVEALPPGALVDGQVINHEAVAAAVQRAFSRSGAVHRRAGVVLPASAVINKTVRLPAGLGAHEIDERLRREAEQVIPFALEEAALDYQVMGPCRDDAGALEVAFCACHQAAVDNLEAVLELAGLTARVVDLDSHALQRALAPSLHGWAAMVQVEADALVFHLLSPGQVGQRSEIRLAAGGVQVERLAEQIDRWLLADPAAVAERLWLCGAKAGEPGLAEQLQRRLGIPTQVFGQREGLAPELAVAYGLALRGDD